MQILMQTRNFNKLIWTVLSMETVNIKHLMQNLCVAKKLNQSPFLILTFLSGHHKLFMTVSSSLCI